MKPPAPDPSPPLGWSRQIPAGAALVALLFLALCGMVVLNFWLLGWEPEPGERVQPSYHARPCAPGALPRELRERLGDDALPRLQTLNGQLRLTETFHLDLFAGAPLVAQRLVVGDQSLEVRLPVGMLERLAATAGMEDGPALAALLLRRAQSAVRDPDDHLGRGGALRGRLQRQVLQGAFAELERHGALLAAGSPIGQRRRVVIRGQARQVASYVIGQDRAGERERASFEAWAGLLLEAFAAWDLPVERFELGLDHGGWVTRDDPFSRKVGLEREWVEGQFDLPAWVAAVEKGEDPTERPFHELGRLQALQLLSEAGLVEVLFLGHGEEVGEEALEEGRYQPFRLGAVTRGDEYQELLMLRRERRGMTVRYGACLDARAPFWAASCSNRHGGETRPDQSTAAVAFVLQNGWYPDAASLDRFVFGCYRALQSVLLEAPDSVEAEQGVRRVIMEQRARFEAPGELRAVLGLQAGVYLLRAGGGEAPDLLLLTDPGWLPDGDAALRLVLATSAWELLGELAGSSDLEPVGSWDPCAGTQDCGPRLDAMLAQARRFADGGVPPDDADARYLATSLWSRQHVRPDPDATNRFIRVALLRDEGQPLEAYLLEVDRIRDDLREALAGVQGRRRIQGFVLTEEDGTLMDPAALEGFAWRR